MNAEGLRRLARQLREEVQRRSERLLIEGAPSGLSGRSGPLPLSPLSPDVHRRAKVLEELLLEEFSSAELTDVYEVQEVNTDYGPAVAVANRELLPPLRIHPDHCRRELESAVRLLWGIGPATEKHLKSMGFRTLRELASHSRWSSEAKRLLERIEARRVEELAYQVWRWYSVSHPLSLALLGLVGPERVAFLDIETLGMATEPIILVGLAWQKGENLFVKQLVVRSIPEELPVLAATLATLKECRALVTFNGRAFDLNFLESRFSYYGLGTCPNKPNFDLLHFARRRWRDELPNCRLETLERHILGIERPLDIPSSLVPEFYIAYLRERNVGPLVAVIEHNRQDLVSMALLLARLWEEWYG